MVPVAGTFVGQAVRSVFFDNSAYADRIITSPMMAQVARSIYGVLTAAQRVSTGGEVSKSVVRDFAAAVSTLAVHPAMRLAGPLSRPLSYIWDVSAGDARPTGPIDFLFGLTTGRASEASRR